MRAEEPAVLLALAEDLLCAWNAGARERFAELFTLEARYTTGRGVTVQGREAIAGLVNGGAIVLVQPPAVALDGASARMELAWREVGGARDGVSVLALVRDGQGWRISSCTTTAHD